MMEQASQGLAINRTRAEYVRTLRVAQGRTWPEVAKACIEQWALTPEALAPDQPPTADMVELGRSICEASASLFGEDPNNEPWN